jgi:hypothetical protein
VGYFELTSIDMNPILNRDGAITEISEIAEKIADWVKQFYFVISYAGLIHDQLNGSFITEGCSHEITTLISHRTCRQFFWKESLLGPG